MATQYRFPEITDEQAHAMLAPDEFNRWKTSTLCIVEVSAKRENRKTVRTALKNLRNWDGEIIPDTITKD